MRTLAIIGATVAATLAAFAAGAGVFVTSGVYDIGSDDHHIKPVFAIIEAPREAAIAARSHNLTAPNLEDGARIEQGARYYAAHCPVCHLAPGMAASDVRRGMYPHPPNLVQEGVVDPR